MQKSIDEIKDILKNYRFIRMQIENGIEAPTIKAKVEFIEKSIKALSEQDYLLINGLFFDKVDTSVLMRNLSVARRTLYSRKDAIIASISLLYQDKFG